MLVYAILGLVVAYIAFLEGIKQSKLKDYDFIEPRYNELVDFYKQHCANNTYIENILAENNVSDVNRSIMLMYHKEKKTPLQIWEWYIDNVKYVEPESIQIKISRLNKKLGLKPHNHK